MSSVNILSPLWYTIFQRSDQELLLNRKRCAGELQQLWQELDLREMAFTDAALEAGHGIWDMGGVKQ